MIMSFHVLGKRAVSIDLDLLDGKRTTPVRPPTVVLNALETCDYKVVAASTTPIGTLYMWTLQGPVDREVDQAYASSFRDIDTDY